MNLSQTRGLNFSELITMLGTDEATRGRVFMTFREDDDRLSEYTYGEL